MKTKQISVLSLAMAAGLAFSGTVHAQCEATRDYTAGWMLVSPPCAPADINTIQTHLGDDAIGTYGSTWILYSHNPATNGYAVEASGSPYNAAQGYWFNSLNGAATLDVTGSAPAEVNIPSPECDGGCYAIDLSAAPPLSVYRNNLIGSPFSEDINWSDVTIYATSVFGWPSLGFATTWKGDPAAAEAAGFVRDLVFRWNGSGYDSLNQAGGAVLPAAEGVFVQSLDDMAVNTLQLLIPKPAKVIFVTSQSYDANLGGLSGADLKCQTLADASDQVPPGTYKAWLSDNVQSAADRLTHSIDPYYGPTGTLIADNWDDLTDGVLQSPIEIDETGTTTTYARSWTGTEAAGAMGTNRCWNWTNNSGGGVGVTGDTNSLTTTWSNVEKLGCDEFHALYCMKQ